MCGHTIFMIRHYPWNNSHAIYSSTDLLRGVAQEEACLGVRGVLGVLDLRGGLCVMARTGFIGSNVNLSSSSVSKQEIMVNIYSSVQSMRIYALWVPLFLS